MSQNLANSLLAFKSDLDGVKTFTEAYQIIEKTRTSSTLTSLTTQERTVFQEALNSAEKTVCYEETSQNEIQTRGLCEECSWVMHWEALVISIIVTVPAFLVSWLSFGLASGWAAAITITVWAAVWVLHCEWVHCDEDEPCPDGQIAECEGSFTFDANIPACTHPPFAAGDFTFLGCIFSPVPASGVCPSGSTRQGQSCLWECSNDNEPARNSDGNWQLPFICR